MAVSRIKPTTIEEYIAAAPADQQPKLKEMQAIIRQAAPGAIENLKWGMPAFSYQKILVTYTGHRAHIGFYPMPSAIKAFAKDIAKFNSAIYKYQAGAQ